MTDTKTQERSSGTEASGDEEVRSLDSSDDPDFGGEDIKEQLKTEFEELAYFFGWEQVNSVWRRYDKKDEAAREKWQDKVHSRAKPDTGKGPKGRTHSQLQYEFVDLIKSYGFEMVTDVLHEYENGQEQERLKELRRRMDVHEMKESVVSYLYRQVVDINDEIQKGHNHNRKYLTPVYCPLCDYCGKSLYDNIIVNVMEPEESRGLFHEACFDKASPTHVRSSDLLIACKDAGERIIRQCYVEPEGEPEKKRKKQETE
jgi:hypothetical protein